MKIVGDLILAVDNDSFLLAELLETRNGVFYMTCNSESIRNVEITKSPCKQKFCQDHSKGKVILEVFFDSQGIAHLEFIPKGCIVNKISMSLVQVDPQEETKSVS